MKVIIFIEVIFISTTDSSLIYWQVWKDGRKRENYVQSGVTNTLTDCMQIYWASGHRNLYSWLLYAEF